MNFDRTAYGARIKKLRIERGITQESLAEEMNVGVSYISKIETGQQTGSIESAINMARFFDSTLDFLLLGYDVALSDTSQCLQTVIDLLIKLKSELQFSILG